MLRIIAFIAIAIAVILFFFFLLRRKTELKGIVKEYGILVQNSLVKLKAPRALTVSDMVSILKVLLYCIALVCIIILALTGFIPYLLGDTLSGFMLTLHVSISPVFAVCMTVLMVLVAQQHVFCREDLPYFNDGASDSTGAGKALKYRAGMKMYFWTLMLLTLFVMGSIIASMYPVVGTIGQRILLMVHRVSAVLFFISSLMHTYYFINTLTPKIEEE